MRRQRFRWRIAPMSTVPGDRNPSLCATSCSKLPSIVLLLCTAAASAASPDEIPYRWANVVVGGGGYSPNIIFSSAQSGLAYLRTDIGGIYRHEKGASGWQPLQDGLAEGNYFGIESLAPDPRDANVVYAAVGMYSSGPAAILRSADRGTHWTAVPVPFRMGGNEDGRGLGERLAVDPRATDILYFGSRHDGLQRSVDQGRTWTKLEVFPRPGLGPPAPGSTHAGISFVCFDPRGGTDGTPTQRLFVGVADPGAHHLYRSDDAGANWHPVPGEPRADLLPVRGQLDARGALYLSYSDAPGPNGITAGAVYRLDTDAGEWHDISPSAPPGQRGGFMGLSLAANRPGTVLAATVDWWADRDTIFTSTDGGEHWTNLRARSQFDVSATPFLKWGDARASFGWWLTGVAVDPFDAAHVAYTTGATVFATDAVAAPTVLWRPWVQDIEETAVLALISPPKGAPLLSGFGDIGGFVHEDLHVSPQTMYLHPQFSNTVELDEAAMAPQIVIRSGRPTHGDADMAWSQDFGHTWTPLVLPDTSRDGARGAGLSPAVAVSADGSTFIVTEGHPWVTRNRGASWARVQGLPDAARVAADQRDARFFYAIDSIRARILVSEDGGSHFAASASHEDLIHSCRAEGNTHRRLFITPGRSGDLWIACRDGLYHSVDGGRRFQSTGSDPLVTELAFGKPRTINGYPTLFAIGTRSNQRALWRSDNGAASWRRINDDAHEYGRRFRVIAGDPRVFGRVYVGTDGRGLLYGEPAN
jgi:xyloglucan-specific exo-beta-1,4-glucanase